jgi:hypothetical protein
MGFPDPRRVGSWLPFSLLGGSNEVPQASGPRTRRRGSSGSGRCRRGVGRPGNRHRRRHRLRSGRPGLQRRAGLGGPLPPEVHGLHSFDVGSWHLIALNSNCSRPADTTNVVDCGPGSAQEAWLRADLAAHANVCTLAYWHHPRFSSGHDGDSTFMQALWQDLSDAGVDVALSGHSHNYERFAPQDAGGGLDRANGIRQFVAGGTGALHGPVVDGESRTARCARTRPTGC